MTDELTKWLPEETVDILKGQAKDLPSFRLKISKPRKSKLGDFRFPQNGELPSISVNADLNSGEFLLTLVHELAHYVVFLEHGRMVSPHGKEWKQTFRRLFAPHFSSSIYNENQQKALAKYFSNVKSSSCYDLELMKALRGQKSAETIENIELNQKFMIPNGKVLTLEKKMRTRYRCVEEKTGKIYSVHPLAEIVPLPSN